MEGGLIGGMLTKWDEIFYEGAYIYFQKIIIILGFETNNELPEFG